MLAESFNITVINPEVKNILFDLQKLNLLKINPSKNEDIFDIIEDIRSKSNLSYDEITAEVEIVRQKMYEKENKS